MRQLELLHSQRVLCNLRHGVDDLVDRMVRSPVQGEGVQNFVLTPFSDSTPEEPSWLREVIDAEASSTP